MSKKKTKRGAVAEGIAWAARRAGRKSEHDAKRKQTTAAGQGREGKTGLCHECGLPTSLTVRKRLAVAGDERTGLDFPLDVLHVRGLITEDMRDEGLRFAMLAWWLYGVPEASCAAIYERMVAEGAGGEFGPRMTWDDQDPDRLARVRSQKARYLRMIRSLYAETAGAIVVTTVAGKAVHHRTRNWTPIRGSIFEAVRDASQFMKLPRFVANLAHNPPKLASGPDYREMARLIEGLTRLVKLRAREDAYWTKRHGDGMRALVDAATPDRDRSRALPNLQPPPATSAVREMPKPTRRRKVSRETSPAVSHTDIQPGVLS